MTKDLVILQIDDTVDKVDEVFRMYPFHHLPVVDDQQRLVGIVSNTDLERLSYGKTLFQFRSRKEYNQALYRSLLVKEVMVQDVFSLSTTDTLGEAYEAFRKGRFRAIPIVDDGILVGLVTPVDLIEALLRET